MLHTQSRLYLLNNCRTYFLILFTLSVSLTVSIGQSLESRFRIENYTDEHGLPQSTVKTITADNMGFIWLSTENGMARFDGRKIVDVTIILKGTENARFFDVLPDMLGRKNRFYAARYNKKSILIQNGVAVYDSVYDYNSLLKRLSFVDDRHSLISFGSPGLVMEDFLPNLEKLFIPVIDHSGCYFKITRNQIAFYENWKLRWTTANHFTQMNKFFVEGRNLCHLGNLGEILRYEKGEWNRVSLVGDLSSVDRDLGKARQPRLFWNMINRQFFLLIGERFYLMKAGPGRVWKTELLLENFSFEDNQIRSVYYEPDSKSLLLGSITKGLFLVRKQNFTTLHNSRDDMENVFYGQAILDSNRILLPDGQVLGIRKQGNEIIPLHTQATQRKKKPSAETRYTIKDRFGRFWISMGDRVEVYSSGGEKLLKKYLFQKSVACLFEKLDGEVIVGVKEHGFYLITSADKEPVPYFARPGFGDGTFLLQPNKTTLWMGTDKGLYRFDLTSRTPHLIPGTERFYIRSMHLSKEKPGTVFFTTFDNGLFYFNGLEIIPFPLDERGYLSSAHCIAEDGRGYFWLPTNKGLFRILKDDLYRYAEQSDGENHPHLFYLYYTKSEGFVTNEFNGGCQPCTVRLPNGFLSLPSLNGLVMFEPEQIEATMPNKNLIVDRLEEKDLVRHILGDTVHLDLNPRNVTFYLSTAYFGNPENLHFSYAMMHRGVAPTPKDWLSIKGPDPTIRFSELGSGDYTLWVRKQNGFGLNHFTVNSITVFIPLNWYETLWFRLVIIGLVIGMAYTILWFRTRNLRHRNQQLESNVAERTRNLQEALGSLQVSEKELSRQMQLQARLIASISHDVRTPINYFAAAADMAGDMVKVDQKGEAQRLLTELGSSARHIFSLVDNLVNFSKSQIYGLRTKVQPVRIQSLIEEKIQIFRSLLIQRKIVFQNELPIELEINTSTQLLGIVIHNLLDNALKHTRRGSMVRVTFESRPDGRHLIFSDHGPGLSSEIISWLNASRREGDVQEPFLHEYQGLGLLIVKEIAVLLEVTLYAENTNGASIHLIFS